MNTLTIIAIIFIIWTAGGVIFFAHVHHNCHWSFVATNWKDWIILLLGGPIVIAVSLLYLLCDVFVVVTNRIIDWSKK